MERNDGSGGIMPDALRETLTRMIDRAEHPREMAVDVMFALQAHFGFLCDRGEHELSSARVGLGDGQAAGEHEQSQCGDCQTGAAPHAGAILSAS